MHSFSLTPGTVNIRFGAGAVAQLPELLIGLGKERPFVVTDPGVKGVGLLEKVEKALSSNGFQVSCFDEIKPNPTTTLIDKAAQFAVANQADCIVALGGGSSLDSAKGIALVAANPTFSSAQFNYSITPEKPALPIIAIPTTSGTGSETNNWGVIDDPERHCKFYVVAPTSLIRLHLLHIDLSLFFLLYRLVLIFQKVLLLIVWEKQD